MKLGTDVPDEILIQIFEGATLFGHVINDVIDF